MEGEQFQVHRPSEAIGPQGHCRDGGRAQSLLWRLKALGVPVLSFAQTQNTISDRRQKYGRTVFFFVFGGTSERRDGDTSGKLQKIKFPKASVDRAWGGSRGGDHFSQMSHLGGGKRAEECVSWFCSGWARRALGTTGGGTTCGREKNRPRVWAATGGQTGPTGAWRKFSWVSGGGGSSGRGRNNSGKPMGRRMGTARRPGCFSTVGGRGFGGELQKPTAFKRSVERGRFGRISEKGRAGKRGREGRFSSGTLSSGEVHAVHCYGFSAKGHTFRKIAHEARGRLAWPFLLSGALTLDFAHSATAKRPKWT